MDKSQRGWNQSPLRAEALRQGDRGHGKCGQEDHQPALSFKNHRSKQAKMKQVADPGVRVWLIILGLLNNELWLLQ